MCKLKVRVSNKNAGFVIYNHLYSRGSHSFSIEELVAELQSLYGLDMDADALQYEINDYLESGLVIHSFDKYKCCMS